MTETRTAPDLATLRAEHDALARRLEIRRSIDHVRRGAYVAFGALLGVGLSLKLAWDRWGTPPPGAAPRVREGLPLFFLLALALTLVLLAFAARDFVRARRLMREEDRLFARFKDVRAALRLDP
jgi:hypothetical protein